MTKIIKNATENQTPQDWMNWLTEFGKRPYVLSKNENIALRDAVTNIDKAYERVAHKFFYETLKPMLSGLAFQVLATYKTIVDERDIATIIYRKFWDGGNFSRLKGFKGECSLFSWISIGAAQVVYEDLEELGIIKKNRNLTPKNTSLRLKSFTDIEELKAVLSLVSEPRWHDILTEIYVNCTSEEDIMICLQFASAIVRRTISLAKNIITAVANKTSFNSSVQGAFSHSRKGRKTKICVVCEGTTLIKTYELFATFKKEICLKLKNKRNIDIDFVVIPNTVSLGTAIATL